jgi:hypothetical protein
LEVKPGPRLTPVAEDRARGDFQDRGGFFDAQPAKIAQLDDLALPRVEFRQRRERIVERDDFGRPTLTSPPAWLSETCTAPPPRFSHWRARVIHQHPAHHPRRQRKEMIPVLPVHLLLAGQPQVSLVDQGRGLERMVGAFPLKLMMRRTAQLLINQRQQLIQRCFITLARSDKQLRNLRGG